MTTVAVEPHSSLLLSPRTWCTGQCEGGAVEQELTLYLLHWILPPSSTRSSSSLSPSSLLTKPRPSAGSVHLSDESRRSRERRRREVRGAAWRGRGRA